MIIMIGTMRLDINKYLIDFKILIKFCTMSINETTVDTILRACHNTHKSTFFIQTNIRQDTHRAGQKNYSATEARAAKKRGRGASRTKQTRATEMETHGLHNPRALERDKLRPVRRLI